MSLMARKKTQSLANSNAQSPSATSSATSAIPDATIPTANPTDPLTHKRKKGWTNDDQYNLLDGLMDDFQQAAADGTLPAFKAMVLGLWQTRYPERFGKYFLDRDGKVRKFAACLIGVEDSGKDVPFPKMVGGVLDLGPAHCLDGCDLAEPDGDEECGMVEELNPEIVEKLYNWFRNHKPAHRIRRGGGLTRFSLIPTHVPQPIHKYSKMYYTEGVLPHVITEAKERGVVHNDLTLVKEMTVHAWANESPEIKQSVMDAIEKDKELIERLKDGTLDINVSDADKCIYNYTCQDANGKDFIKSFNENAMAGYIPGTIPGDSRTFSKYFGVPFMHHMKKITKEAIHLGKIKESPKATQTISKGSLDVDPAHLFDDAPPLPELSAPVHDRSQLQQKKNSATLPVLSSARPSGSINVSPPLVSSSILAQNSGATLQHHSMTPPNGLPNDEPLLLVTSLVSTSISLHSMTLLNNEPLSPVTSSGSTSVSSLSVVTLDNANSTPISFGILPDTPSLDDLFHGFDHWDGSSTNGAPGPLLTQSNSNLPGMYHFSNNLPGLSQKFNCSDLAGMDWTKIDWTAVTNRVTENLLPMLSSMPIDVVTSTSNPALPPTGPSESTTNDVISNSHSSLQSMPPAMSIDDVISTSPATSTITNLSTTSFQSPPKSAATRTEVPLTTSSTTSAVTSSPVPLPDVSNVSRLSRQRRPVGQKEVTTLSVTEKEQGPPRWIAETVVLLTEDSLGLAWAGLLEKWHQLERDIWSSDSDPVGKLTVSKRRPHPLTLWLDGTRYFDLPPDIRDYSQFASEMVD
ncbi:hypothetical protein ARMGADRAFT_1079622 [Armillaria gallica]|uniref:Uncharacterized protein n=1 Tax=Armillaria gallica TaxID=47427 RepID=A0A2H3DYH0_ARMGA|nr:hypothetical protein ARMGADRAFT_1079622 [Armillaria gallica]